MTRPEALHPWRPNWALPPGATLEEVLEERSLTRDQFADQTGLGRDRVDRLITGEEPVSETIATVLYAHTGVSTKFWLNAERIYRDHMWRMWTMSQPPDDDDMPAVQHFPDHITVYAAQGIRDDSWLQEDRFADFRTGYNYASGKMNAIPGLSKVTAEEAYYIYTMIRRGIDNDATR